jgi:hypothetical protein
MAEFDPDAWLKEREESKQPEFDPDRYLKERHPDETTTTGTVEVKPTSVWGMVKEGAPKFGKGLLEAGAGAVSGALNIGQDIGEGGNPLGRLPGVGPWAAEQTGNIRDIPGVGPYIGPAAKILFPPSTLAAASELSPTLGNLRKQVEEFGDQPTKSDEELAGKIGGYLAMVPGAGWAMAGRAVLGAGSYALGTLSTFTKWQIADAIGEKLGLPPWAVYHFLEGRRGGGRASSKPSGRAPEQPEERGRMSIPKFLPPKTAPAPAAPPSGKSSAGPQSAAPPSSLIAAAKLAKKTGAFRPEDKDEIERLSKLPLPGE